MKFSLFYFLFILNYFSIFSICLNGLNNGNYIFRSLTLNSWNFCGLDGSGFNEFYFQIISCSCYPGKYGNICLNNLTSFPTFKPTFIPSRKPSREPTYIPSIRPSILPTFKPSSIPTYIPSIEPSYSPSIQPSSPTFIPSTKPTFEPSTKPTFIPTFTPSLKPTNSPSTIPSFIPSSLPSYKPTIEPSTIPTYKPSTEPTFKPSFEPSSIPTIKPTFEPSIKPTYEPTSLPSFKPTYIPSISPTLLPSSLPSTKPTFLPSSLPTLKPTFEPSTLPTFIPTNLPSFKPSTEPTINPTLTPTTPTSSPSIIPSIEPSILPTFKPSSIPTLKPSSLPSSIPTLIPSSFPSVIPTLLPSSLPSTKPTFSPSSLPTLKPTFEPSNRPTYEPTNSPSFKPTFIPSSKPTFLPSSSPTFLPTLSPETKSPTLSPTSFPTIILSNELVCNKKYIPSISDTCLLITLSDQFGDGWTNGDGKTENAEFSYSIGYQNDDYESNAIKHTLNCSCKFVSGCINPIITQTNQYFHFYISSLRSSIPEYYWEIMWKVQFIENGIKKDFFYGGYTTQLIINYNYTSHSFSYDNSHSSDVWNVTTCTPPISINLLSSSSNIDGYSITDLNKKVNYIYNNPFCSFTREPTLYPTGIPTNEPTNPTTFPTLQPTNQKYLGFHYYNAPYIIIPPILLITLIGLCYSGFSFGFFMAIVFPTLDLITDLLYFAMNDFATLPLFVLMPIFIFLIPIIYLFSRVSSDKIYIPSIFSWLIYSWKLNFQGLELYYNDTRLFNYELSNLPIFLIYWLFVLLALSLQIGIFFLAIPLYPIIIICWFTFGLILVQSKMLSLIIFEKFWMNMFMPMNRYNRVGVEPNELNNQNNQEKLSISRLHALIILEIFTETLPQFILQTYNNQLLQTWSLISLISSICSGFMLLTEIYHYGYWMIWRNFELERVPISRYDLRKVHD